MHGCTFSHIAKKLPEGLEITCVYFIFFPTLALSTPSGLGLFLLQHTECLPHRFSSSFSFLFNLVSSYFFFYYTPASLVMHSCAVMWLTAKLPFSYVYFFLILFTTFLLYCPSTTGFICTNLSFLLPCQLSLPLLNFSSFCVFSVSSCS